MGVNKNIFRKKGPAKAGRKSLKVRWRALHYGRIYQEGLGKARLFEGF